MLKPRKHPKTKLTIRETSFIKQLSTGKNIKESAILAGYSPDSLSYAYIVLKKQKMIKALEDRGITNIYISDKLKENIDNGTANYTKATPADALKGIDIATRLMGYQDNVNKENSNINNTQINIYKNMNSKQLVDQLDDINKSIKQLTNTNS